MTPAGTTSSPSTADVDAARLLLTRMGLSPQDLLDTAPTRPPVPTFAEYVPVVAAAVGPGTCRVYGSYWNRILDHWADRRLDDPTPSEIKQLVEHVKHNVVARRNARGGPTTRPARSPSPDASRRPGGPSLTTGLQRSTASQRRPATTPPSTH